MLVYIINVLTDETVDVLISGTPWWEEASAVVVADRTKLLSTMLFGWDVSATCVLAASDVVLVFAVVPVAAVLLLAVGVVVAEFCRKRWFKINSSLFMLFLFYCLLFFVLLLVVFCFNGLLFIKTTCAVHFLLTKRNSFFIARGKCLHAYTYACKTKAAKQREIEQVNNYLL